MFASNPLPHFRRFVINLTLADLPTKSFVRALNY